MHAIAAFWKGSSSNLYVRTGGRSGRSSWIISSVGSCPSGIAISCLHVLPVASACGSAARGAAARGRFAAATSGGGAAEGTERFTPAAGAEVSNAPKRSSSSPANMRGGARGRAGGEARERGGE
ncbi:hypothetical protein AB1Y20_000118 [Prymnesium parvum]|uniref:Uncharacterized protein n=1 Tax=Prymnesium parvum TaxID=97485 RepID=A0AB34K5H5_PRYPA